MSLLELDQVSKRYLHGSRERVALREVSLQLDPGELVGIWGLRRSGRSTLLRLAAGIESPDAGAVRFAGSDLARASAAALGSDIGYCRRTFHGVDGRTLFEELTVSQLARGIPQTQARTRAREALERTGASGCAELAPHELDSAETARVAIARALASKPSLLLADEPTKGVDMFERDGILELLRSLARDGMAVLMSTGESTGLFGADRALSLSEGEMHGSVSPELAPVVRLPRRANA